MGRVMGGDASPQEVSYGTKDHVDERFEGGAEANQMNLYGCHRGHGLRLSVEFPLL